ncbi:uncharacterized protein VTP21DRAFT_8583 [Calcarisporiella thermophila]|uniref:uncharacterized protein n=1 Tax=Calcarisporiella thermophila TaxID=911321 RepID=UPI0037423C03
MGALSKEQQLPPWGHALAGAGGAAISLICIYPLDIIKTRLQVQSKTDGQSQHYASTVEGIRHILREEGPLGLFAGLPAALIGVVAQSFAYFYFYTIIRQRYQKRLGTLSTATELWVGAVAGALTQLFTLPINVITTRQQTLPPEERKSLLETGQEIVRQEGWATLWKGLRASLVLTVNPAITYGMFERVKALVLRRLGRKDLTPGLAFFVGATSKTLATVVTYPYIMAKVRMQWKAPRGVKMTPYRSGIDVLTRVYKSEGVSGWYKGMQAQITKAVLSQALLFMIKEELTEYTLFFILLARRMSRNPKAV